MFNRSAIRSALFSTALAATALGAGVTVLAQAAPAHAAARVGGVDVVSVATLDGCEHRIYVEATPHQTVNGRFDVYFRTAVFDRNQWIWSGFYLADGITNVYTNVSRNPGRTAYVQYARLVNGVWQYNGEYIPVEESVDSLWAQTFC